MDSPSIQFFETVVRPTALEYLSDHTNIRRARLACIVLYHMADYWLIEQYDFSDRKTMIDLLNKLHAELINECSKFTLIRDVADASKHAELNAQTKIPRTLSSSAQVQVPQGFFEAPMGEGVFAEQVTVTATLNDGTKHGLADAIEEVLHMWTGRLAPVVDSAVTRCK